MTEAEIALQIAEMYHLVWTVQQWWASISLGLLVLAHVAYERLNLFLVTIIIVLYTAFSAYLLLIVDGQSNTITHYLADLQALAESGHELATGTLTYMEPRSKVSVALTVITLWGTYAGCTAYLLYSYIKGRRATNA